MPMIMRGEGMKREEGREKRGERSLGDRWLVVVDGIPSRRLHPRKALML